MGRGEKGVKETGSMCWVREGTGRGLGRDKAGKDIGERAER